MNQQAQKKNTDMNVALQDNDDYIIEIEHLQKKLGKQWVLRDINLKLKRGENIVILGKSGTGKTILIKCIAGLINPDAGNLRVFGEDIFSLKEVALNQIRTKIGFLFQGGALYDSMNVRENLLFPLLRNFPSKSQSEQDSLVKEVLESVGLPGVEQKMPSELSGGMQKRVALARALVLRPEIILYDEPTTGLDPVTAKGIGNLILDIQREYHTASIVITHDIKTTALTANRVMVLRDGIIIAEGTYDELRQSSDEEVNSFFK